MFNDELMDDGDYARVNHRTQRIELNPIRPKSQQDESFIHELLHIINCVYNNHNMSEDSIDASGAGLFQILSQWNVEFDFSQIPKLGD